MAQKSLATHSVPEPEKRNGRKISNHFRNKECIIMYTWETRHHGKGHKSRNEVLRVFYHRFKNETIDMRKVNKRKKYW